MTLKNPLLRVSHTYQELEKVSTAEQPMLHTKVTDFAILNDRTTTNKKQYSAV
jgi:hypothetical protein